MEDMIMKVVDMHCDTLTTLLHKEHDNPGKKWSLKDNDGHLSLEKMQKGDYLLQNFAIFTPFIGVGDTLEYALIGVDRFHKEMEENSDLIEPVYSYQDILDVSAKGKMCGMLTLEEGGVVHNDLRILNNFYRLGVRMITLTWNFANDIGHPNCDATKFKSDFSDSMMPHKLFMIDEENGLTPFGIEYVKRMEELGIIIDVSHLSDKGFWDVIEHTTKPFVASHSNSRAVRGVGRNMTDDMIKALAKRGGVMGMNYCEAFVDDEEGRIPAIIEHIKHIKEIAGIDVVGLGSDFDGIGDRHDLRSGDEMPLLAEAMRKEGFTEEEIEKVFYKNVLRVYKEVLK